MTPEAADLAGILLTGGASRRMGRDKGSIVVDGETLAVRIGHLLAERTTPAIEIGPGLSGLDAYADDDPGAGPLAAVATGARVLAELGYRGPALVVACDIPLLDAAALDALVLAPGTGTVLPEIDGHDQPLVARWSNYDLTRARVAYVAGERSFRTVPVRALARVLDKLELSVARRLTDADTPEALAELLGYAPG